MVSRIDAKSNFGFIEKQVLNTGKLFHQWNVWKRHLNTHLLFPYIYHCSPSNTAGLWVISLHFDHRYQEELFDSELLKSNLQSLCIDSFSMLLIQLLEGLSPKVRFFCYNAYVITTDNFQLFKKTLMFEHYVNIAVLMIAGYQTWHSVKCPKISCN